MDPQVIYSDERCTITRYYSAAGWRDETAWAPGCEPAETALVQVDAEALAEALATGWRGGQSGVAGPGERGDRRRQIDASGLARSTFYYRLKRGRIPGQGGADPPAVSGFAS